MYLNTLVDKISRNQSNSTDIVTVSDITVCLAIRANHVNPWVLPRLEFALSFYQPAPKFLIVDFGSDEEYAQQIQDVCHKYNNNNIKYLYIDDKETFSLSKARNIAGRTAETDFLFFTDVDFVFDSNMFAHLASLATKLELQTAIRRYLPMPIYHVGQEASAEFESISNDMEKDRFLTTLSYLGQGTKFKNMLDFVAPYSNAFLINKHFFNLSGGYCDEFRGHGSEDFEYMIRLGLFSLNAPLPSHLNKDFYGPLKESFFEQRDYAGFRRYAEILTATSESLGLRAFHIWHPSPKAEGYWTAQNDWKRDKFNLVLERYYPNIEKVLNVDFHPREKKALCLFNDPKQWGYFLPLRLSGYQLTAFTSKNENDIVGILNQVENKVFDRLFIFNPYMKSHFHFRVIIEVAKRVGVEVTVIERGGLPNSIYYASEVAYGDKDYKKLDALLNGKYQVQSEKLIGELVESIKTGNEVLESQDAYADTWKKYTLLRHNQLPKIFIPLQLPDDMAVTQFTDGYTSFSNFYDEIKVVAEQNKEVLFIVKQHPLMKTPFTSEFDNLMIADNNANIHSLIDICDATVVYNSGVGLLSCIHQKPTFNIGNAYYTAEKYLSNQVSSIQEAINKLQNKDYHTSTKEELFIFLDWLMTKKYSWFTADNIIREFQTRKSHGYDNIMVEVLNLDGKIHNSGARYSSFPFSTKSYLGWKTGLNLVPKPEPKPATPAIPPKQPAPAAKPAPAATPPEPATKATSPVVVVNDASKHPLMTEIFAVFLSDKKARKLREDPKTFFADSKNEMVKMLGKLY